MGGGSRFPYPKEVWSPAGGWWTRPSNWKSNTAIAFAGILVITYGAFAFCADREVCRAGASNPLDEVVKAVQR
ncbi:unnamed protein product [Somion occarium]|uniref:Uncharacterized protein n=1 Tax=Somion occarium TaxID=3059160 RepID=A0ABP1DTF2_9APHY